MILAIAPNKFQTTDGNGMIAHWRYRERLKCRDKIRYRCRCCQIDKITSIGLEREGVQVDGWYGCRETLLIGIVHILNQELVLTLCRVYKRERRSDDGLDAIGVLIEYTQHDRVDGGAKCGEECLLRDEVCRREDRAVALKHADFVGSISDRDRRWTVVARWK